MKAVRLSHRGGSDKLRYEDAPRPAPASGEVLIRVHAAAVTPTELSWHPTLHRRDGTPRPLPVIPGHEFSGVVEAIGQDCAGVDVGEQVYGMNDWFVDGAQAEYCLATPDCLAPKPSTVNYVESSVVPISALTAWQALLDHADLQSGQRVLIHGGAGGVGSFAVQLARHLHAHVTATASPGNIDLVRSLGADQVIDYRSVPFESVVEAVDVVLDTVGGETRDRSWNLLKEGGRLITVASDGERRDQRQRDRDAFFIVEPNRTQLTQIARLIDAHVFRVVMGKVFPLEQARLAYELKPEHGKHVVRVAN